MNTKSITRIIGVFIGLGAFVALANPASATSANLLTNPGAESDGAGWTTISNGGNGMSYSFDGIVRSGSKSFQTSHGLDSISQTVDLFANGYSVMDMNYAPEINFSVWLRSRPDQAAQYYVNFSLLEDDGTTVVTSTSYGSSGSLISIPAGVDWFEKAATFSGYRSGVRYLKIEFGGRDQSTWGGNYGIHIDDASVTAGDPPRGGGGIGSMPSSGYIPPKGPFLVSVAGDANAVETNQVVLNLAASPDVNRMAVSRYEDFHDAGIVPVASSLPWSVCGAATCEPGTYTVYTKFYQAYGISSPVQQLTLNYAPQLAKKEDVQTAVASSTAATTVATKKIKLPTFARTLRQGDKGEDVKRLQVFLNANGFQVAKSGLGSPGNESDVFGPALKRAVARFQEANADQLLQPLALKKGTGIFSVKTRELVNAITDTTKTLARQ